MNFLRAFQYFAVAGFINALVLSLLLSINKKNHLAKIYMISLVLLITFQAILNAFDTRDFFLTYPHLSKISWLIPSLFGPLIYLFTVKLCSPAPVFKKTDLLHFIPFAVYFLILLPWYLKSAEIKRAYLSDFELAMEDDFGFLNQFSILLVLVYLIATLIFLKRYRNTIRNTFSEISQKRLEWMSAFAYGVLLVLIISVLGFYGHKWDLPVLDAIYHYNYIFIVLLVYWIAYKALLQPVIFDIPLASEKTQESQIPGDSNEPMAVEPASSKYVRSGLGEEQMEQLYKQLINCMKRDKPYLNPEINIFELAGLLQVKKHHLSQVINEKAGMNFFDFLNSFRVEEIKQNLLKGSSSNLTLLGIALDSGFNSKATFNSAFKKLTGITPSDFQRSLKMKSDFSG
jgi:AraC-like DNA-binding protein